MKSILFLSVLLAAAQVFAESYSTFVDVVGRDTVSLSLSSSHINAEEVQINGTYEPASITGSVHEELVIKSESGKIILQIGPNVKRSEWTHHQPVWFSNGDSRLLTGPMIINGREVNKLVEIFATE